MTSLQLAKNFKRFLEFEIVNLKQAIVININLIINLKLIIHLLVTSFQRVKDL